MVSDGAEIEIGILGGQVSLSIGDADKGDADLNMDHLVRTRIEGHEGTGLRTGGRSRAVVDRSPMPRAVASKRAIKLSDKVEGIVIATAANSARSEASYLMTTSRDRRSGIRIPVDAASSIHHHGRGG